MSGSGSGSHGRLPLILVVEDFEELYELYSDFLAGAGYAVAGSNNGVEAVEQAKRLLPDLIIMDLGLAKLNGWEALRLLKSDGATRDIPTLALTGHTNEHCAERARAAGCDGVLFKPCGLNELLAAIEVRVGHGASLRPS
jgi:CheY-like chemotaxis protein